MADLSNQRYAELLGYTQQLGSYDAEDLLAAGFSPAEISAFETAVAQSRTPAPPAPESARVRADTPTFRERHSARLAELFGGEDYDRGDLLLARQFTGSADPTATFADQMGLADLLGAGVLYGADEGANTMVQGIRSKDLGTVALGVGETVLNALGAVPGVKFVTSAGGKLIDEALDASRRAEADRFFLERQALAEGYSAADLDGARLFVPTEEELAMMRGNPTPNEQVYLENLERAREMADEGKTVDEIFMETHVLHQPVAGLTGQALGTREVYAMADYFQDLPDPDELPLRNPVDPAPMIKFVPQKELRKNTLGDYNPDTGVIRISDKLDMEQAMQVAQHEKTHFDLRQAFERDANLPEIGSDPDIERTFLADKVKEFKAMLKDPSLSADQRKTIQALLKDIRTSESGFVNYANNPGEILARAASGEPVGYDLVSPKQRLNPYINAARVSNTSRGLDALLMKLRPDLVFPLRALEPAPVAVPMDVRRGQVNDIEYEFSPR